MNDETMIPPSRDEARAALAEVEKVLNQTRLALAHGPTAPMLVLWGSIWLVADATTQFYPAALQWLWWVLDGIGIAASWWVVTRDRWKVKQPGMWRIGVLWMALFGYAATWMLLLLPQKWPETVDQWGAFEPTFRRLTAYAHTVPMFGYVMMGLLLGRFFIWLGLLVTVLIIAGLWVAPHYFYLWLGVTGGGSLILAGVFIKKFWK